ncbi:hypothetical protein Dimus_030468 [Dionaea muscipula]
MQEVEGEMGSDDMMLPTDLVCSNLPCVPSLFSADETASDGGFPPSSPVEPVSERVEKDKGTHGCAFDAWKDHGESHLHLRFSLSHFKIWFSLSALARDLFSGPLLRLEMMDSSSGDDIGDAEGRFLGLSDIIEIRRMRLSDSSNSSTHIRRTVSDLSLSAMLPAHLDSPVVDVVVFSGVVIPHGLVGVGGLDLDGAVPQMATYMFDSQGRVVGGPGALVLGGQFCPDLGACETPETAVEVPGPSIPDLGDCSSLVAEELQGRGSLLVDVRDDGSSAWFCRPVLQLAIGARRLGVDSGGVSVAEAAPRRGLEAVNVQAVGMGSGPASRRSPTRPPLAGANPSMGKTAPS